MANIRLFGLVLIITSLLLGVAAVTTQTATIRIGDTGAFGNLEKFNVGDYDRNKVGGSLERVQTESAGEVKFITVPVAYPLLAACCLGLVLWFLPEWIKALKPSHFGAGRRPRRKR